MSETENIRLRAGEIHKYIWGGKGDDEDDKFSRTLTTYNGLHIKFDDPAKYNEASEKELGRDSEFLNQQYLPFFNLLSDLNLATRYALGKNGYLKMYYQPFYTDLEIVNLVNEGVRLARLYYPSPYNATNPNVLVDYHGYKSGHPKTASIYIPELSHDNYVITVDPFELRVNDMHLFYKNIDHNNMGTGVHEAGHSIEKQINNSVLKYLDGISLDEADKIDYADNFYDSNVYLNFALSGGNAANMPVYNYNYYDPYTFKENFYISNGKLRSPESEYYVPPYISSPEYKKDFIFGIHDNNPSEKFADYVSNEVFPDGWNRYKEMHEDTYGTYDNLKSDGGINIKPSHKGRLTEYLKRTGKTELEAYETGGPAVRKMVTFARNARKWKHGDGGNLFDGDKKSIIDVDDSKFKGVYEGVNLNGDVIVSNPDDNTYHTVLLNKELPELIVLSGKNYPALIDLNGNDSSSHVLDLSKYPTYHKLLSGAEDIAEYRLLNDPLVEYNPETAIRLPRIGQKFDTNVIDLATYADMIENARKYGYDPRLPIGITATEGNMNPFFNAKDLAKVAPTIYKLMGEDEKKLKIKEPNYVERTIWRRENPDEARYLLNRLYHGRGEDSDVLPYTRSNVMGNHTGYYADPNLEELISTELNYHPLNDLLWEDHLRLSYKYDVNNDYNLRFKYPSDVEAVRFFKSGEVNGHHVPYNAHSTYNEDVYRNFNRLMMYPEFRDFYNKEITKYTRVPELQLQKIDFNLKDLINNSKLNLYYGKR